MVRRSDEAPEAAPVLLQLLQWRVSLPRRLRLLELLQWQPSLPRRRERRVRLLILCPRRPGAVLQRCARLPVARRERRPSLAARLHAPLSEGVIERALQHLDFGSGDPLRSARLGKRRPLVHDVHQVLDPIRRCTRPGCRAGILQGHFSAVELSRRQRAHARRAPRPLHRRIRLLQRGIPDRGGAAGRERRKK